MLPGFLHETGLIAKAPIYKDTQDLTGLSHSGFINTRIILQRSEYNRSDNKEEDSSGDDPLFSNAPISVETRKQVSASINSIETS